MIKYLANTIDEYKNNKKGLDERFVYKILNKALHENNLESICSNNNVFNYNNPFFGSGNSMEYVYPNGVNIYIADSNKYIMDTMSNYVRIVKNNYTNDTKTIIDSLEYFYCLRLIMMLMHEVEHVKQNYNYNNIDTFEGLITTLNLKSLHDYEELKVTKKCNDIEFREALNKFYNYRKGLNNDTLKYVEPIERYANIHSTDLLDSIINELTTDDEVKTILYQLVNHLKTFHYLYSYYSCNKISSPLDSYIKYLKELDLYKTDTLSGNEIDNRISEYSNATIYDRLLHGLEITEMEYDYIKEGKIKIR